MRQGYTDAGASGEGMEHTGRGVWGVTSITRERVVLAGQDVYSNRCKGAESPQETKGKRQMNVQIVKYETATSTRYGLCHANSGKLLRGTLLNYKTRKGAENYAKRHGYTIVGERN